MKTNNQSRGLALLALPFLLAILSACRPEAKGSDWQTVLIDEATTVGDSVHISIAMPEYSYGHPAEDAMEQLNELLGGTYEGSYNRPDSLARHYANLYLAQLQADRTDLGENLPTMPYLRTLDFDCIYTTTRVITYRLQLYEYTGGAHGLAHIVGLTLRKRDGRRIGLDVFNDRRGDSAWNQMLLDGLMQYFEVGTEDELAAVLFNPEDARLAPMPQTEPYFTADGLTFVYQSYEIAPYAAGQPTFTIPYEQLRPYFNITGRRLFE